MISTVESTNFSGDSVPNAGNANEEIQAGTGEPGSVHRSKCAVVNAPLSQSSLRAADSLSPTVRVGSADGLGSLVSATPEVTSDPLLSASPVSVNVRDGREPQSAERGHSAAADSIESEILELLEAPMLRDGWRIDEANRRLQILQTYEALIAEGATKADAVKQVGQGYATIWRWQKAYAKDGYDGLIPDTEKCGRKSTFDKLGFSKEQVEQIINEVRGINLDTNSVTASLRMYANSDRCPPELASVILDPNRCSKHALPPSLRDAAKVNKNQRKAHRGPRALSLGGIYTPRKMDILPGDIFCADDTTPIWGWWVPWVTNEEYPFGVKLLQGQFIPMIDVASQMPVSYVLLAREKGSYRASDIWHLFGHTFDTVGIPRLGFQLERGSWEANLIRGQEIVYGEGEATYSRRIGGLRQIPSNVSDDRRASNEQLANFPKQIQTFTSYLPKSKSIEAFLNRSQTFEGTLWGCLGRDQMRAPFEKAKKIFQACQRGSEDPRNHFLSYSEMGARLNELLRYIGSEPMEGEVFYGVPEQRFNQAVAERPLFNPNACEATQELQWLWRRDWTVVTITSGWARVRLTDPIEGRRYSLFYGNPVFADHEGEEVAVYYDRENFEKPAQIILARTGDYLCDATYEDRKGSFLGGDMSGHDARKQWRNAVMSVYGTLVKHAPSRQLPPEIAARRAESRAAAVATAAPALVDGRPTAPVLQHASNPLAPRTPEELTKQSNRVSRQAEIAQRLRRLSGE